MSYYPPLTGSQLIRQQSVIASVSLLVATKPVFPIVLMTDAPCDLPSDFLGRLRAVTNNALKVVQVEPFHGVRCDGPAHRDTYFQPTYGILRIFSLKWLDAALYLDSDTAVVQNLDYIIIEIIPANNKPYEYAILCLNEKTSEKQIVNLVN